MGRRLDGKFDSFKAWLKRFFRRVGIISISTVTVVLLILLGGEIKQSEVIYQSVQADSKIPPVLQRIAKCESPHGHLGANGQVQINPTQDIGKYQINVPTWGKKATELGLNLAVEEDNEAMAVWIYENRGTGDWSSSAKCWNK